MFVNRRHYGVYSTENGVRVNIYALEPVGEPHVAWDVCLVSEGGQGARRMGEGNRLILDTDRRTQVILSPVTSEVLTPQTE